MMTASRIMTGSALLFYLFFFPFFILSDFCSAHGVMLITEITMLITEITMLITEITMLIAGINAPIGGICEIYRIWSYYTPIAAYWKVPKLIFL